MNLCDEEIATLGEGNIKWVCPSCSLHADISCPVITCDYRTCPLCESNDAKLFKGLKGLRIHWSKVHPSDPFPDNEDYLSTNCKQSFQSTLSHCHKHIKVLWWIPNHDTIVVHELSS